MQIMSHVQRACRSLAEGLNLIQNGIDFEPDSLGISLAQQKT